MNQDIKKNEWLKVFSVILVCILIVFLGCKIVRKMIKPRSTVRQESEEKKYYYPDKNLKVDNEVAVNVLFSFLQRGIEEGHMPTLDKVKVDKVFYIEEDSTKLICASYHLSFSNGNNPTWETCLKTDDGSKISSSYDSMNYVGVLTESAFLYKMIPESDQAFELATSIVEEQLNQKLKDNKDDFLNDNDKEDKKNNLDIPMA